MRVFISIKMSLILTIITLGAVHKVRHAIFGQFLSPSPCNTSSHIPGPPPKVRHTSSTPRFLEGLVQKTRTKAPLYKLCLNCSRGFCPGGLSGSLLSGRFCLGWFLSVPVLSEYICYNRKLNLTLNFVFRMYNEKFTSVTSHALYPIPLSQIVTPSRTPSPLERDVLYGRPLSRQLVYGHFVYDQRRRLVINIGRAKIWVTNIGGQKFRERNL